MPIGVDGGLVQTVACSWACARQGIRTACKPLGDGKSMCGMMPGASECERRRKGSVLEWLAY